MALLHELIAQRPASTTRSSSATPTRRSWWCSTTASARACSPSTRPPARRATAATRTTSSSGTQRDGRVQARPIPKASPTAAIRRSKGTTRSPTARASRRRSSCCASGSPSCTPEWAAAITGIPAERIRKLARELGDDRAASRPSSCRSPGPTPGATSTRRRQARPVAFHAMRGLAAHSNGFQTVRALAILMSVLGTIDRARRLSAQGAVPAPHRAQLPRPSTARRRSSRTRRCNAAPLGFPAQPGGARGQPPTARRSASTRRSPGSIRCRRTA